MQYKYTFQNTRGQQPTTDYMITNRDVHPSQFGDVRTLNAANPGTDCSLLLLKIRVQVPKGKEKTANLRISIK
jgi:hypothetical protein